MRQYVRVTASQHLGALTWVDVLFERYGIEYWLFGGWAVDFLAGAVTRPHDDIDIAVWAKDAPNIFALLEERGWMRVSEQDGYTVYEHAGVRLEIAFLARDGEGIVYTPLQVGRAFWPQDSFGNDIAELGGRRMRVISLAALKSEKSDSYGDPEVAAKNEADLQTLARIGSSQ